MACYPGTTLQLRALRRDWNQQFRRRTPVPGTAPAIRGLGLNSQQPSDEVPLRLKAVLIAPAEDQAEEGGPLSR